MTSDNVNVEDHPYKASLSLASLRPDISQVVASRPVATPRLHPLKEYPSLFAYLAEHGPGSITHWSLIVALVRAD